MTRSTLHPTPRPGAVVREQLRAVALLLRLPALGGAALLAVAVLVALAEFVSGGGPVEVTSELAMIPGLMGALLPIALWKDEDRFGAGFLWTLPVDRRLHAFARIAAGWVWLMAAVAVLVVTFLVLAVVGGADLLGPRVIHLLPAGVSAEGGPIEASALRIVRWSAPPIFCLVPFTGATGAYLLVNAFALGSRHPLRWIVGIGFSAFLVSSSGNAAGIDWLRLGPANVLSTLYEGRYGIDALLTARAESLRTFATLTTGWSVPAWRGLPDFGDWAIATLLWTTVGLVALWFAASRHREQRRSKAPRV